MSEGAADEPKDEIHDLQSNIAGDIYGNIKGNHLPIARVKKIMKEGEHNGMIAADAPVILAKACEMLVKDLTLQSWDCTLMTRRCTLQKQDVTAVIFKNNLYNFLFDIFSPEELKPKMEASGMNICRNIGISGGSNGIHCMYPKVRQIKVGGMKNGSDFIVHPGVGYCRDGFLYKHGGNPQYLQQFNSYQPHPKKIRLLNNMLSPQRYIVSRPMHNGITPTNSNHLVSPGESDMMVNKNGQGVPNGNVIKGNSQELSKGRMPPPTAMVGQINQVGNGLSTGNATMLSFGRNSQQYITTQAVSGIPHMFQSQMAFNSQRFGVPQDDSGDTMYQGSYRQHFN